MAETEAPKNRDAEDVDIEQFDVESHTRKDAMSRLAFRFETLSKRRLIALGIGISLFLWCMSTLCAFNLMSLIWKGSANESLQGFLVTLLALITTLPSCLACCRKNCMGGSTPWRAVFICSPVAGWLTFLLWFLVVYSNTQLPMLLPEFDSQEPVVVVGTGPSGLSAAWLLAKSGRRVLILEAEDEIGGHSKSVVENNMTIDIGFIFNNHQYTEYMLVANHMGYPLIDTDLNTSGAWRGDYWDNTRDDHESEKDIKEDIERWMVLAEETPDFLRLLTPLGTFLWWNGFSEKFYRLCIESTMTVLFVTKMGALRQSAAAVLTYFKASEGGFIHLRPDNFHRVQYSPKGSQNMWHDIIADMNSTGLVQIQLKSKVTSLRREKEAWTLDLDDGRSVGGYEHVVLACPANAQQKIISNPWHKYILSQIEYVDSYLTLHTDAENTVGQEKFSKAGSEVLYFVEPEEGVMTGKIGQIFGNSSSDLLLSVHFDQGMVDESKVKKQYVWSHHMFHIWELGMARYVVPLYYPQHGIHLAGDWIYGVGHNDAIKSGVAAACQVGIPETLNDPASAPLYDQLVKRVCVEHTAFR